MHELFLALRRATVLSAPYGPPGRHSLSYAATDSSAAADRTFSSAWLSIALRTALRADTRSAVHVAASSEAADRTRSYTRWGAQRTVRYASRLHPGRLTGRSEVYGRLEPN